MKFKFSELDHESKVRAAQSYLFWQLIDSPNDSEIIKAMSELDLLNDHLLFTVTGRLTNKYDD